MKKPGFASLAICQPILLVICDVRAPSEAWCILQGGSPCRERANHLPVSYR